jgi:hypothetical protein
MCRVPGRKLRMKTKFWLEKLKARDNLKDTEEEMEGDIKIGREVKDWTELAKYRSQMGTFANTIINYRIQLKLEMY